MRHAAKRDFIPRLLSLSTFTIVLIFLYIPILVLVVFSFNDSRIISPWHGFTLKYFFLLFKTREIMSALKNTLVVAVLSTLTSTILGTITALALENRKFTGRSCLRFAEKKIFLDPQLRPIRNLCHRLYNKRPTGSLGP